jgi:hypothetical protein
MKLKRAQLALAVAVLAVLSSVAAAAGSARTPTMSARLFAKAGPLKVHAHLTVTLTHPASAVTGQTLSNCVVQAPPNPRMGIATRLICTNTAGQSVVVAAPSSASLTYHFTARSSLANVQSATVAIRHKNTVVATLSPTSGTVAIPLSQTAALLNGHDKLYVKVGGHTYHGNIARIA